VASRIATARAAKRLTQQQLAAAAAISASLLRKIERGVRPATPRVFLSIAEALDVDPGQLAGTMAVTDGRVHASIPVIRLALDMYDFPDDGPIRALPELGKAVATAQRWRLNSQYTRLAQELPELVTELCRGAEPFTALPQGDVQLHDLTPHATEHEPATSMITCQP